MAIADSLNNWAALGRYMEDGDLAIDCSAVERSLRGFLGGQKNRLFFGSDRGGETTAVLRSLIVCCQ